MRSRSCARSGCQLAALTSASNPAASSAHMVVNIASLPSTVTFVIGLGRNRGPRGGAFFSGGACAFAAAGHNTALQHSSSARCKRGLVMKPVSVLFLTILAPTQSPAKSWFFDMASASCQHTRRHSEESRNLLVFLQFLRPTFARYKSICLSEMYHFAFYDFRRYEKIP